MTSMDDEQSSLLSETLHEVLSGPGDDISRLLSELGWDEVLAEDPATATTLLFTEQGRTLATTALLDQVVIAALADDLPGPVDAVCYPALAGGGIAGQAGQPISGLLLREPAADARIVVVFETTDGPRLAIVSAADLQFAPVRTFDESLNWVLVRGDTLSESVPAPSWPLAVAAAHRAIAAELVGLAEEVLRVAVEHTSARHQFGAPIAAFQAVRHRLAEGFVAIAGARSLVDAAFIDGSPISAMAAKAQAGRAHEQVSAHALQVCGAMGSSLEHPLHRFVTRGTVLDALLGGWSEQVRRLGRLIQSTGETPRLIEV
ncbi:MAG: putative acyl-CoA dehydrogenase [Pseudonocardiales bacterium]|nr:putative acyl-CoA dehydrogenase [Pseudonocardiales bacterium]